MIGIRAIASHIPENRICNLDRMAQFDIDENFIRNKLGIVRVARASEGEKASHLALKAYAALESKQEIDRERIDSLIVVTQNPDTRIPHVSSVLHGEIGLPAKCACFDVSLGCSGYVYGLAILKALMEAGGMNNGLLFTCDPYSEIVDSNDKNTALLFGDAATVTLLSEDAIYDIGRGTANTEGSERGNLVIDNEVLKMNGRAVFNFTAQRIPSDIKEAIAQNGLTIEDIDLFLLHQGSKFIVETIGRRLNVPLEKVPFAVTDYGNTVSSSIPLLLEHEVEQAAARYILVSGFGVGLSWSSNVLIKRI
jgi:3-oxoacyl-[acyl-carrier-protein] synthase-3